MLNGSVVDVAIGLLLVFLVTSVLASALVEAVGGLLHRRQKHLWDSLDLLLGNTSVAEDPDGIKIVDALYRQPFITGLIPPNDRLRFDPATGETVMKADVPLRGRTLAPDSMPTKTRASGDELARRFYGPVHIAPAEFANSLLTWLRPGGSIDQGRAALAALREATPRTGVVALDHLVGSLSALDDVADDVGALDLRAALARIRAAGAAIDADELRSAARDIDRAITRIAVGELTSAEVVDLLATLPTDLRTKLTAVVMAAGDEVAEVRAGIERWFERNMAAASMWYRRQTRWFLFAAGIVLAASLNIDAVRAATTMYRDEGTRAAVVAVAEQVGEAACADAEPDAQLTCISDTVGGSVGLPVGWAEVDRGLGTWPVRLIGWFTVAVAATLGGPFWYDLLRRALATKRKS